MTNRTWMIAATLLVAASSPALAQIDIDVRPIPAPKGPPSIALGTGSVANMPAESWFYEAGHRAAVRNVSHATLTPVLPSAGKATGAAVIVLPGGGFNFLAMENEGWPVARWLADHGIAAFVLKYRLNSTPVGTEEYKQSVLKSITQAASGKPLSLTAPAVSIADARAALRTVRARAAEWKVDPKRIGLLGFSAGALTALEVVRQVEPKDMPAFLGLIYGPMTAVEVPAAAPPLFASLAADDPLFGKQGCGLTDSWRAAGKPVELHVFESGGHGYGLGRQGTTTIGWIEGFQRWLGAHQWLSFAP